MQTVNHVAAGGRVLLGLVLAAMPVQAQRPTARDVAALQRLLVAEDARGKGAEGLTPLREGLKSDDSLLRRVAVRGIGRLQHSELARLLIPLLDDPLPAVRAEAANAVAQGEQRVRRGATVSDASDLSSRAAQDAIIAALAREQEPRVVAALAEALGRLPLADSNEARVAERAMRNRVTGLPSLGIVRGMYSLARTRRFTGGLSNDGIALLRRAATRAREPEVRRLSVLALGLVSGLDSITTRIASGDRDAQVRRLALAGAGSLTVAARAATVRHALADTSVIVRVAAVGAARALAKLPDCGALIAATRDRHPYVALIAIDSLGAPCAGTAAARDALASIVDQRRANAGDHSWQAPSRALRALARVDTALARARIAPFVVSKRWQERTAAAQGAVLLGDADLLLKLAADGDQNVREAAVTGLAGIRMHAADSVYIAALHAPGYQVVLAGAEALAGSASARALPALLDALDRLTAPRSENARDPRLTVLRRIGEMGSNETSNRLTPYLTDFDTTVASTAASLLARWSGRTVVARPLPLPIRPEPLARLFLTRGIQLRVTMAASSGGGSFTIALFPEDAPATVARLIRLAKAHYYDGHTFQRVEPNFVFQGGGPGATEYIGDAAFMRDELTARSHSRGAVGISARGRDTGDAQLFINLVDNPRLDHEYTVFGEIIFGRGVAERVMEGDTIARIEVIGAP